MNSREDNRQKHWINATLNLIRKNRPLLMTLSAAVVFITTYLLILPALTLDEQEAARQGGIDLPAQQEQVLEDTAAERSLSFDGDGYAVTADCDAKAGLPEGTELAVSEIEKDAEDYDTLCDEALQAVQAEDGGDTIKELKFARFYDISLMADGAPIEPGAPVDVTISYDKAIGASDAEHLRIVHFGENGTEVLDPEHVSFDLVKGKLGSTAFAAESFSVYALVYTVDFSYSVDGETYEYSVEGGDAIELRTLLPLLGVVDEEDTDRFMDEIEDVQFSAPKLVEVRKADGAADWTLTSLKPFDTEETLAISMKNGDIFTVIVTDEQNATMKDDGKTVQTIPNPSGTRIDIFDYWIDKEDEVARRGWPGYDRNGTTGVDSEFWNKFTVNDGDIKGINNGNEKGINEGHKFKFTPSMGGTVTDYLVGNGTSYGYTKDGTEGGMNSWNGWNDGSNHYNGAPTTGIVADALYDADGSLDTSGYPRLNLNNGNGDGNNESLDYLFNPDTTHSGKASYSEVDNLFYVDPDGYFTYNSTDYKASLDKTTGEFTVTEQPTTSTQEGEVGFWPMGNLNYWLGMHLNADFSIPAEGKVLNPKGEYMPMQFEFAGDDDAWAYIDGILVADGGGIHNRTQLDINFQTGKVQVIGGVYDNINDPNMDVVSETTLYQIFKNAKDKGLISQEKWDKDYNDSNWVDADGDGIFDTFASGTYHTFDFFYLERGGGESNLYIHYNLVATEDFTGHKAVDSLPEDERMYRDDYTFELIGLGDEYTIGSDEVRSVIMPMEGYNLENGTITGLRDGEGTFTDPKMVYSDEAYVDSTGQAHGGYVLTTGVSENGDIRFGTADIDTRLLKNDPYEHKYIVREVVPDEAVNADGTRWDEASAEQKAAGGFVLNDITYDGRVYYMKATVSTWGEGQSGLTKTYYTDDTFTVVDDETKFVDFRNVYTPSKGRVSFTKTDGAGSPLSGAQFTLFRTDDCAADTIAKDMNKQDLIAESGEDGVVSFENVPVGTYYMKETRAPRDYALDNTVYKVTIEDSYDRSKQSKIVMNGDETEKAVTEIVNTKPGELVVKKEWQDQNGNIISGADRTARVKIQRKKWAATETETHTIRFNLHIDDNWGITNVNVSKTGTVHDSAVIEWYDSWQNNSGLTIRDANGNTISAEVQRIDANNHSRRIVLNNITSDIMINVNYDKELMWLRTDANHWVKTQDVLISDRDSAVDVLEEDTNFNNLTSESQYATLSSPNWSKVWTIGDGKDFPSTDEAGNKYQYYIVEVDSDGNAVSIGQEVDGSYTLIGYSANNTDGVAEHGMIRVCNQVNEVPADLTIHKVDADTQKAIGGASFYLMKGRSIVTDLDIVSLADGNPLIEPDSNHCFTVPEEGACIRGLTSGSYKLVEREAPAGYIITEDGWEFTVNDDGTIFGDEDIVDGLTATIPNTPGVELPSAGGPGTTWIYLLGTILLLGCGITLAARRRAA